MKIHVNCDSEVLLKYEARGSPNYLEIYLEHNGEYYPEEHWKDFGGVIIGWWLTATIQLAESGKSGSLEFMDGPYSIRMALDRKTNLLALTPRNSNNCWVIDFADFKQEIVKAATNIYASFREFEVGAKERLGIEKGIRLLNSAGGRVQ